MSRREEYARQKRAEAQRTEQAGFWPELCRRIAGGQMIPIISNSVFLDPILDIDGDGIIGISTGEENPDDLSIEEQLADTWAAVIEFPLPERYMLARVALYDRFVNSLVSGDVRVRFLDFLKDMLLNLAADDPRFADQTIIADLRADIGRYRFSDIAAELGYHRLPHRKSDPSHDLAKLKLPIYVTTSYYDFLERAIRDNNRTPRTQICFWSKEPVNIKKEHKTDLDYVPSPEEPLVFHLFGLEDYPESMVLSEAEHLDFLAAVHRDVDQSRPVLPRYLLQALTQSSLLVLGYRLQDWDWRVLFRGVIADLPDWERLNLAIQLDPRKQRRIASAQQVMAYLSRYLGSGNSKFVVEWGNAEDFTSTLWETWQKWQR